MLIGIPLKMTVYQRAKRIGRMVDVKELMDYCEANCETRDMELYDKTARYLYNMADGYVVTISGDRPEDMRFFVPKEWNIRKPGYVSTGLLDSMRIGLFSHRQRAVR